MKKLPLYILILLLTACKETGNNADENISDTDTMLTDTAVEKEQPDLAGCYIRVTGRDTLLLQIIQNGDEISGTLEFDNYEKDSSTGSLKGKKTAGNIIHVYYDYFAEGMRSVREMYFKPGNDKMIMAIGDMDYSGDTARFTDVPHLNYKESETLTRTDCEILNKR